MDITNNFNLLNPWHRAIRTSYSPSSKRSPLAKAVLKRIELAVLGTFYDLAMIPLNVGLFLIKLPVALSRAIIIKVDPGKRDTFLQNCSLKKTSKHLYLTVAAIIAVIINPLLSLFSPKSALHLHYKMGLVSRNYAYSLQKLLNVKEKEFTDDLKKIKLEINAIQDSKDAPLEIQKLDDLKKRFDVFSEKAIPASKAFCKNFRKKLAIVHLKNEPLVGQYTQASVRVINHVTETFEWKKQLIASARSSIEISANFAGGEPFQETLKLIQTKMKKNPKLRVHIIVSKDFLTEANIGFLNKLALKPNFVYLITDRLNYISPFPHTEENHVKLLVVDGQYFCLGGSGISEKMTREIYSPDKDKPKKTLAEKFVDDAFRDTDLVGFGDLSNTMRRQFFELFSKWEKRTHNREINRFFNLENLDKGECSLFHEKEGLIENVKMKIHVSGSEVRNNNPITNLIVKRIKKAKKSITFASLLFNPDNQIKNALRKKLDKPTKITGYFNGLREKCYKHYIYTLQNRPNYGLLNHVYEYEKVDQLLHKKVAIFDGLYTMLGTNNLGIKSAECDDEMVGLIKDERVAQQINNGLSEDAKYSKVIKKLNPSAFSKISGFFVQNLLGSFFG